MLTIRGLSKSFDGRPVLQGIDLSFSRGEVYGIVGENGAGKTTLFKCIAGLENHEGSVAYDGGVLKNELGYLPADPYFFSHMTGGEYLQLMCQARGIRRPELAAFNVFELPLQQYAETYSTGMQKKLAITGLLLQKNEVFILDEPFNGVDISSNLMLNDLIRQLKELNKTIIMSSHIFSSLEDTCDYLHYLKAGSIQRSLPKGRFSEIEKEMQGTKKVIDLIKTIYKTD